MSPEVSKRDTQPSCPQLLVDPPAKRVELLGKQEQAAAAACSSSRRVNQSSVGMGWLGSAWRHFNFVPITSHKW